MTATSLYLHIPFCRHRCGYCDFNTYAGLDALIPAYTEALCAEVAYLGSRMDSPLPLHTLFFGGGTPSLLPASQLERILAAVRGNFDVLAGAEVSLEANPGTLSQAYLHDLRRLGINRLSLGMQSASPEELRLLEREHSYLDVIQAVTWARQAGFDNLNLDLIFGLPYQQLKSWQSSLELALGLHPEHISLYALTLEHGTPLGHWAERGLLSEPDPDLAAEMYEWASERLEQAGYQQYEISNWAQVRAGEVLACRHNLQYWRNLPYLGLGAGAHGYASQVRTATVLAPAAYIQRLSTPDRSAAPERPFPLTPATQSSQPIDRQMEIGETMMTGLRLVVEGISNREFEQRFGETLEAVFAAQIEGLVRLGLLDWVGDEQGAHARLRLSASGRLLGNRVFREFI